MNKEERLKELEQAFFILLEAAFENNEIWTAYSLLKNSPSVLTHFPSEKIERLKERIYERLDYISGFQKKRVNSGFVDIGDPNSRPYFIRLLDKLRERPEVKTLVDVGCFSGWVGRGLSLWGYKVHGIDLDPDTLEKATYLSGGTKATFEVLNVMELGEKHPHEYDGAILFDVFEHVFDPFIALISVENAVKENGWLFFNIPMPDFDKNIILEKSEDVKKEHLHSFSQEKINNLFGKKRNLEIEKLKDHNGNYNWFVSYQS